jgi:hypothetical protein
LADLPAQQLRPAIVPLLGDQSWSRNLFGIWMTTTNLPSPVRKAIVARQKEVH